MEGGLTKNDKSIYYSFPKAKRFNFDSDFNTDNKKDQLNVNSPSSYYLPKTVVNKYQATSFGYG